MTLDDLKAHLAIDGDAHDMLLARILAAATAYVAELCPGADGGQVNQAILMLAAHWFENREAVSSIDLASTPMGFDDLIAAHRTWGF